MRLGPGRGLRAVPPQESAPEPTDLSDSAGQPKATFLKWRTRSFVTPATKPSPDSLRGAFQCVWGQDGASELCPHKSQPRNPPTCPTGPGSGMQQQLSSSGAL